MHTNGNIPVKEQVKAFEKWEIMNLYYVDSPILYSSNHFLCMFL